MPALAAARAGGPRRTRAALPMLVAAVTLAGALAGCSGDRRPTEVAAPSTAPQASGGAAAGTAGGGAAAGSGAATGTAVGAATAAAVTGPPLRARFFRSPSGNITCEFDDATAAAGTVYCQTGEPPQSVHMDVSGTWSTCHGVTCLGNAGEGTVEIPYGRPNLAGPFTCVSSLAGMTCLVGGRGFRVAREGIVAVTAPPAPVPAG